LRAPTDGKAAIVPRRFYDGPSAEGEAAAASEAGLYLSGVSDEYAELDRSQCQAA